jgi:hypothetical protein
VFDINTISNGEAAVKVLGKASFTDGTTQPSPNNRNIGNPRGAHLRRR